MGERFQGAVLVPTADEAVKDLSRSKRALERYYIVACPEADVVERFIDKRHTYELAAERGIPIPKTLVPENVDALDAFDEEAVPVPREAAGKPPVCVAVRDQAGRGHSLAEMRSAYLASEDAGVEVVIQELIPGPDIYGVNHNAYRWDGQILAECTARKVRLAPPAFRRSTCRARGGHPRGRRAWSSDSRGSRVSRGLPAPSSNTTPATACSSSWR